MENDDIARDRYIQGMQATIALQGAVAVAETAAFLDVLELIANQAGVADLNGRPIREVFHEKKMAGLEEGILRIGDKQPALGEGLQIVLENMRKRKR